MEGALIILAVTVVAGIILYLLDVRNRKRNGEETHDVSGKSDHISEDIPAAWERAASQDGGGECCGLHLVCEKELDAISENRILYYDDEELDRFKETAPEEYSPEEIEEFRDVLMTLLPTDVPGWARSLDRRGIRPPQEVRDELMMMLQELK